MSDRPELQAAELEPKPAWADPEWQAAVDRIICQAEDNLRSPAGREAMMWLRGRGLLDHTIGQFRLGFIARGHMTEPLACLPPKDGRPTGIYASRGIVIPYVLPGAWHSKGSEPSGLRWAGANVRCLPSGDMNVKLPKEAAKYMALNKTERGHLFPHPDLLPTQGEPNALIVEGELDALIGWQQAGHVVYVATIGGAQSKAKPSVAEALACCPNWLISTDHDAKGVEAAQYWRDLDPEKARRALLPHGKDLGEYHQGGGDVLQWLKAEHDRLGWLWPLA